MNLIGAWVVDRSDHRALTDLGDVVLEFGERDELVYRIRSPNKDQIIKLSYRIDGTTIVTDQLSAPQVEHTEFAFTPDGGLRLTFGGIPYRFVRSASVARVSGALPGS